MSDNKVSIVHVRLSSSRLTLCVLSPSVVLQVHLCTRLILIENNPGFAVSIGIHTGAVGITISHELGHKNTRVEQWLGEAPPPTAQAVFIALIIVHFDCFRFP